MLSAAAEEEKLHQVTFNTNHVLCSSAAAAGCWILDTSAGTVTLTGQSVQPADTAVYYCVRWPTVTQTTSRPAQILSNHRSVICF
ncbi:hypothetical protein F7725_003623 [Dissostichus mawsoni]|uniref:Immunoglobulin V-set domain-containing protein n=1 Tax=Dissostichus mawsoni TaxID=36200 RepID=A0A7J5YAV5_DISMA|nr:hypothetical protein F7725_003623 [Dissostichus mawsoni]